MIKNDIIEYVMNTPHNTNRAVLESMLNQVNNESGGNIDVAEVTIISNCANSFTFSIAEVTEADELMPGVPAGITINDYVLEKDTSEYQPIDFTTVTLRVPLYKGAYGLNLGSTTYNIDIVGAASVILGIVIMITGDCTITISDN